MIEPGQDVEVDLGAEDVFWLTYDRLQQVELVTRLNITKTIEAEQQMDS